VNVSANAERNIGAGRNIVAGTTVSIAIEDQAPCEATSSR
jgi:hypothetical protein